MYDKLQVINNVTGSAQNSTLMVIEICNSVALIMQK